MGAQTYEPDEVKVIPTVEPQPVEKPLETEPVKPTEEKAN